MKIACIMDPLEAVNVHADTTFDWLLAAQTRGHEIFFVAPHALSAYGGEVHCVASELSVRRRQGDHFTMGEAASRPLADFDVCWMRKDPPFDDEYLYSTYLLELADRSGACWVLNDPRGLRAANEKAFILHYPSLIPETLVTHDAEQVKAFMADHGGRCVVKPLDGHGGAEVFFLKEGDLNVNTILEVITRLGTRYVMAQQYVPEARQGDKRVILIDGEPLGAVLRVPKAKELRGNLHVGGKATEALITDRDRDIAAALAPRLKELGLYFVGIDVLGPYLTEVNVTSPTGIQEMSRFDGVAYSERWIAWQEAQLAKRAEGGA